MNCKGNELAYLVVPKDVQGHEHNGKIVFVTTMMRHPNGIPAWYYEGEQLWIEVLEMHTPVIADEFLRPLGNPDEDAVDETLTWKCGKPPVVDVDAIKKDKQKEKVDA